jgi:hypothetical protein
MLTLEELKNICLTKTGKLKRQYKIENNKEAIDALKYYFPKSNNIIELLYRLKYNIFEIPKCPTCNKELEYSLTKRRYKYHCNSVCASKDINVQNKLKQTKLEKYGDANFNNKEKFEQTCISKYGCKNYMLSEDFRNKSKITKYNKYGHYNYSDTSKTTATCIKRYGTGRNNKKVEQTMIFKYGVKSYLQSEEVVKIKNNKDIQEKIQNTKRKNNTFNTSKPETKTYNVLKEKYPDTIRQYKSNLYPFNCDFYIPSLDLYIECNYHWTHGNKPFEGTEKDNVKLENWKSKNTKYYNNAINTWTKLDVNKRTTAKLNNLNYIEFFNENDFNDYINNL